MTADDACQEDKASNSALIAFIPFGSFLVYLFYQSMPLRWISLASLLKSVSLVSIYANITKNDILWSMLGVWAFLTVCTPVYLNIIKTHAPVAVEKYHGRITFASLFKTCSDAVFSDYRIALLAKTPLVMQVLAGGSVLYGVFGADWLMHALAGFGIGAMALKAYKTAVNHYGYSHLASYFRLDRFQTFRVERKKGSAEFTLFSLVVVALIWEVFERAVYFTSPINVFRIGAEPLWNIVNDIIFVIVGGMTAWYLIHSRQKWL